MQGTLDYGEVPRRRCENGSLGFVKREFALHERTTSSCIFEEWRDQHGIAEVARAARTRFLRQAV